MSVGLILKSALVESEGSAAANLVRPYLGLLSGNWYVVGPVLVIYDQVERCRVRLPYHQLVNGVVVVDILAYR